jgi:hypothetical protein
MWEQAGDPYNPCELPATEPASFKDYLLEDVAAPQSN